MPRSRSISIGSHGRDYSRRPKKKRPPTKSSDKTSSAISLKTRLIRIFSDEWEKKYGTKYIPSETDGKSVYYNVAQLIEDEDEQEFLSSWRELIRNALNANMVWEDGEADEAGRPTLFGIVNRYNDIKLLSSGGEDARIFYSTYTHYRRIWGCDSFAAYRSAAQAIHRAGYRLAVIDPSLLKKLKARFSNRELGLQFCPVEDRLRFSNDEIRAEIDGNPELMRKLFFRSRGIDAPVGARLVAEYLKEQKEGSLFA